MLYLLCSSQGLGGISWVPHAYPLPSGFLTFSPLGKILIQWSCFNIPLVSHCTILHPTNSYSSFRTVQYHSLWLWDTLGFPLIPFLHGINSVPVLIWPLQGKGWLFLFCFITLAPEKHSINFCCISQEWKSLSALKWRNFYWLKNIYIFKHCYVSSLIAQTVKESSCKAGDLGSMPGLGRFPGEGNGYLLQYSYVENSMDRRAWQATVHEVTKSRTRLTWLSD